MTTSRELLDLIHEFVTAKSDGQASAAQLQSIAQRFDVTLGEVVIDRASMQNEA